MVVELYQERVRRVQAVRWTNTEICAAAVRTMLEGLRPTLTPDADGTLWLHAGATTAPLRVDWWVVTDGVQVEVLSDELFSRKYEAIAP